MSANHGLEAENRAASYLENAGLKVLARNWRNRWCEIDVVGVNDDGIHIVEVKYRAKTAWGGAVEYVTPDKISRLKRATGAWCQAHNYTGPVQIDVVTLEGPLDNLTIEWIQNAVVD